VIRQKVTNLRGALKAGWDVLDANSALYECFPKVVIDYRNGTLECHWRHGQPPSVIRYKVDDENKKV
jgi:hypothetical protein